MQTTSSRVKAVQTKEWIYCLNDIILLNTDSDKNSIYQSATTIECSTIDLAISSANLHLRLNDKRVKEDISNDHIPVISTKKKKSLFKKRITL